MCCVIVVNVHIFKTFKSLTVIHGMRNFSGLERRTKVIQPLTGQIVAIIYLAPTLCQTLYILFKSVPPIPVKQALLSSSKEEKIGLRELKYPPAITQLLSQDVNPVGLAYSWEEAQSFPSTKAHFSGGKDPEAQRAKHLGPSLAAG